MSDQKNDNREPGMSSTKETLHIKDENKESSKSVKTSIHQDGMMKEHEGHPEERRRSSTQQDDIIYEYERQRENRRSSLESAFIAYRYLLTR